MASPPPDMGCRPPQTKSLKMPICVRLEVPPGKNNGVTRKKKGSPEQNKGRPEVSQKLPRDINKEIFTKRVAVRAVELSIGAFCTEFRCEQLCDDDIFWGFGPQTMGWPALAWPCHGVVSVSRTTLRRLPPNKKNGVTPPKKEWGYPDYFF